MRQARMTRAMLHAGTCPPRAARALALLCASPRANARSQSRPVVRFPVQDRRARRHVGVLIWFRSWLSVITPRRRGTGGVVRVAMLPFARGTV
jgi:hypothetical protein